MNLLLDYEKALSAIYEEIGFTEDWKVYPLDTHEDKPWFIENGEVHYFDDQEAYLRADMSHSYSAEVFTHRFYPKSIYPGKLLTGILMDTHVDNNRFLGIFLNKNKIK